MNFTETKKRAREASTHVHGIQQVFGVKIPAKNQLIEEGKVNAIICLKGEENILESLGERAEKCLMHPISFSA